MQTQTVPLSPKPYLPEQAVLCTHCKTTIGKSCNLSAFKTALQCAKIEKVVFSGKFKICNVNNQRVVEYLLLLACICRIHLP